MEKIPYKRSTGGYLEALLQSCPDCILAIDAEGITTFANKAASHLFECEMKDLLGKSIAIFYETAEKAKETNRKLYQNGGIIRDHESTMKTKAGKVIPVRISAAHLRDSSGDYTGAVGYFQAYRPWKEEELRLQERLHQLENEIVKYYDLGAPIFQLWDGISISGIVGHLDVTRLERIRNHLIEHIKSIKTKVLLLDISSAIITDSEAIKTFVKLVRTIKLIGAECFITGIYPEIAGEIEEYVTDTGSFRTFTTLEMSLEAALSSVGYKINELSK